MKINPIKKFFNIFFSFKNPGSRIKKVIKVCYIAGVASILVIGTLLGVLQGAAIGFGISSGIASGVADYSADLYMQSIDMDEWDYYEYNDLSYYEIYYARYEEVFRPTLLLSSIVMCPIFAIIGFVLSLILSFVNAILLLWLPSILLYAFGELVENSKQKSDEKITDSITEINDQDYQPQEAYSCDPAPVTFEAVDNLVKPEISDAEQEVNYQQNIAERNNIVETNDQPTVIVDNVVKEPTKSEPKQSFSQREEYQPIKKEKTIPLIQNDPQLAEKLATALQFSTDTAMISYLRGLRNVQVNQILYLPNEEIRNAVIDLMNKENLKHKSWMCSCGAKNKLTARECSVCYKKREE